MANESMTRQWTSADTREGMSSPQGGSAPHGQVSCGETTQLEKGRQRPTSTAHSVNHGELLLEPFSGFWKININLLHIPATPHLYSEQEEMKPSVTKTCMQLFKAALFKTVKKREQPKHPASSEWTKQRWRQEPPTGTTLVTIHSVSKA